MGLGGKRVAGLGGLEEWVSGGRLTAGGGEVAGRACPDPTGVVERSGRGEFSHYNKRGEAGLSSTYLYSLLFMLHPVVFLIGRFAGQVHAEFL